MVEVEYQITTSQTKKVRFNIRNLSARNNTENPIDKLELQQSKESLKVQNTQWERGCSVPI